MLIVGLYILTGILLIAGCGQKETVVARIGNDVILESEFIRQMEFSPAQYEGYVGTQLGKKKYLDVLVNEKLIVQAARREHIDTSDAVQQELENFRKEYDQQLNAYTEKLLIREFLQKKRGKELLVSEQEI
ncbi:MAG: hypothetical protein ABII23_07605, partial [bacterium]